MSRANTMNGLIRQCLSMRLQPSSAYLLRWNQLHTVLTSLVVGLLLGNFQMAVAVECLVTALPVAFGSYDPSQGTPTDTVGDVGVSCTLIGVGSAPVSYTISLAPGSSGSYSPRYLVSGGSQLSYNLYTDVPRSQVWGDGTGGTLVISDAYQLGATPVTRHYPVYGRIAPLQSLPAGTYGDVVLVTVEY